MELNKRNYITQRVFTREHTRVLELLALSLLLKC